MKKMKLLLLAIAIFAVVGTALAFNKKITQFCTRPLDLGTGACTGTITGTEEAGTANFNGYRKINGCNAQCNQGIRIVGEN